jgi:hypothetical protein
MARYNSNNKQELDDAFWAMRQIMWPDNGEPALDEHLEPYDLCLDYIGFGPFCLIVIPK